MTTTSEYKRQRLIETCFKRNDKGEILYEVMAGRVYGNHKSVENEEVKQLIEQHRVENSEQFIYYRYTFHVPESETEPLITALRDLGCDSIENYGPIVDEGKSEEYRKYMTTS